MFLGSSQRENTASRTRTVNDCLPRRENVLDARLSLARVEERSHHLLGNRDRRVAFNVDGLTTSVRKELEEVSKTRSRAETPASVELFMANLGFDVHEQHRLLRHIAASKAPLTAAPQPAPLQSQPVVAHTDLEAFLASRRNEALQTAVAEVHRSMLDRERNEIDMALASVWETRKAELAETVGLRSLISATTISHSVPPSETAVATHQSSQSSAPSNSAALVPRRCTSFARSVEIFSPNVWLQKFTATAVADRDSPNNEALAQQWLSLERIFGDVQQGPHETKEDVAMRAVAASRRVLELKFAKHIYDSDGRGRNVPDLERADARVFLDQVISFVRDGRKHVAADQWPQIFYSLRCGRPDAAVIAATEPVVKAALGQVVDGCGDVLADGTKRELQELYANELTMQNPYRQGVLFLLLSGRIRGTEAAAQHALDRCNERLVRRMDDMLWFHLHLVRCVSRSTHPASSPNASPIRPPQRQHAALIYPLHCLETVQQGLISEQQLIFQYLEHRMDWLVSVMFHALLPATAVRLLHENGNTSSPDAVHIALALHAKGMLDCFSSAEPPMDVGRLVQNYVVGLVESSLEGFTVANAWAYFDRSDQHAAFVDLCSRSEKMCTRLFGQSGTRDFSALKGTISRPLLAAIERIAAQCAQHGNIRIAVHLYLTLHQHLVNVNALNRSNAAGATSSSDVLQSAFIVLNPELSRTLHLALADSRSSELGEVLVQARLVRQYLQDASHQLSAAEIEAFRHLTTLAEVVYSSKTDVATTISLFLQLDFVPSTTNQVDAACRTFNSNVSGEVASVTPRVLLLVFRAIHAEFARSADSEERNRLRSLAQVLLRWESKWTIRPSSDIVMTLQRLVDAVSAP